MNSPPWSWTQRIGRGYLESQDCMNLDRMCEAVLLSMRINSTKFEAVSMQVNALNSIIRPLTLMFHGPIKSIATSSFHAQVRVHILGLTTCVFGNVHI